MSPLQTTVTVRQDDSENLGQDVDVQILPDGDNWAENTTAITGNTSERSESDEGIDQWLKNETVSDDTYTRFLGPLFNYLVIITAFVSPFIMVILPKIGLQLDVSSILTMQQKLIYSSCNIECKGQLLGIVFKIILLGIGNWAVFFRSRETYMPRLFLFRNLVIVLTAICICTYWLFYIIQITEGAKNAITVDAVEYSHLVNYAGNLIDTLLFIHYVAVLLLQIRHLTPAYYLKIVRSPDGISRSYAVGQLSVQRAAIWILEKYYTEFPIYNPFLERLPTSKSARKQHTSNYKFYNVDNSINKHDESTDPCKYETDRHVLSSQSYRRDSSHNERFYEEHEYERRVRKRKARLVTATEEAFSHIQRINTETELFSNSSPLDPMEAAQSIFPSIARSLQKYLRITRQQPHHSIEGILERLAHCLSQDATPRAFLEPYFNTVPVLSNEKEKHMKTRHWALVSESGLPSRSLCNGCEFQLRQGEIALLCSVRELPQIHLTEQIALPESNKFSINFLFDNT